MADPASSAAAGVLLKVGVAFGAGVAGAAIMAAVDPPATRTEMFAQAACAGVGSMVFGGLAVRLADFYLDAINLAGAPAADYLEVAVPIYFLVGALSWGAFGALAKFRQIVRDKAAAKAASLLD